MDRLALACLVVCGCQQDSLRELARIEPREHEPIETPLECMFYTIDRDATLWRMDVSEVTATEVGVSATPELNDVTLQADGSMMALSPDAIYDLSPETGDTALLVEGLFAVEPVAADTLPDGSLLVGGENLLFIADLETFDVVEHEVELPAGWIFSGDLAVIDAETAYASVKKYGQDDHLYRLDLTSGAAQDLGSLEHVRVFGLDFGCDGALYGFTDAQPPQLLAIELEGGTPVVRELGALEGVSSIWGAAGPSVGQ